MALHLRGIAVCAWLAVALAAGSTAGPHVADAEAALSARELVLRAETTTSFASCDRYWTRSRRMRQACRATVLRNRGERLPDGTRPWQPNGRPRCHDRSSRIERRGRKVVWVQRARDRARVDVDYCTGSYRVLRLVRARRAWRIAGEATVVAACPIGSVDRDGFCGPQPSVRIDRSCDSIPVDGRPVTLDVFGTYTEERQPSPPIACATARDVLTTFVSTAPAPDDFASFELHGRTWFCLREGPRNGYREDESPLSWPGFEYRCNDSEDAQSHVGGRRLRDSYYYGPPDG